MGGFRYGSSAPKIHLVGQILTWGIGGVFLSACILAPATETASISIASPLPLSPSPTTSPLPLITLSPSPALTVTPSPSLIVVHTPIPTLTAFSFQLCSPLSGYAFDELPGIESQPFISPRPGKDDGHHGVDFAHWQYKDRVSLEGVEVQSMLQGVVAAVILDKYPYGNMIIVETPIDDLSQAVVANYQLRSDQSLYLLYAHLREPSSFQVGTSVLCGETIGIVGNTGASGNPHLHLETRIGPAGITFDSMEYYKTTSTDEERANYERWRFLGDFILFDPWLLLKFGE